MRMSNGRGWNARGLKTIVIVIKHWLVRWLTIDYAGAGAEERLAIRNTTWLVFGLPTATHAHGGDQKGGTWWLCAFGQLASILIIKFLFLLIQSVAP